MNHDFLDVMVDPNHYVHPFQCPCQSFDDRDRHSLNLAQQITVIAVAILIGIPTFGVGGVFAFYALSAALKGRNVVWVQYCNESSSARERFVLFQGPWWGFNSVPVCGGYDSYDYDVPARSVPFGSTYVPTHSSPIVVHTNGFSGFDHRPTGTSVPFRPQSVERFREGLGRPAHVSVGGGRTGTPARILNTQPVEQQRRDGRSRSAHTGVGGGRTGTSSNFGGFGSSHSSIGGSRTPASSSSFARSGGLSDSRVGLGGFGRR